MSACDATQERPLLLFFHSPHSGRCRLVDGYLAQALQRNGNHDAFSIKRIDVEKRPDLATRFRVRDLPAILVVDGNRVAARIDAPSRGTTLRRVLEPWLRGAAA